jgi:hypothetical protein
VSRGRIWQPAGQQDGSGRSRCPGRASGLPRCAENLADAVDRLQVTGTEWERGRHKEYDLPVHTSSIINRLTCLPPLDGGRLGGVIFPAPPKSRDARWVWQIPRSHQMHGYKFSREMPVSRYIADGELAASSPPKASPSRAHQGEGSSPLGTV